MPKVNYPFVVYRYCDCFDDWAKQTTLLQKYISRNKYKKQSNITTNTSNTNASRLRAINSYSVVVLDLDEDWWTVRLSVIRFSGGSVRVQWHFIGTTSLPVQIALIACRASWENSCYRSEDQSENLQIWGATLQQLTLVFVLFQLLAFLYVRQEVRI